MSSILAIDAAWTAHEPSGVALLQDFQGAWHCSALAPSYADFIGLSNGTPVNWFAQQIVGNQPNVLLILQAATVLLGGHQPDLVVIDMPVATVPIAGRRIADNLISEQYGGQGCSCHSPSPARPGPLGAQLSAAFLASGYPVATTATNAGTLSHLLEVYPPPALLTLMNTNYRYPYKVSKSGRLWPGTNVPVRINHLLQQFGLLLAALNGQIHGINLPLPVPQNVATLTGLKRYEDAIDALVSAWVGCLYLAGNVQCFGDNTSAIWVP